MSVNDRHVKEDYYRVPNNKHKAVIGFPPRGNPWPWPDCGPIWILALVVLHCGAEDRLKKASCFHSYTLLEYGGMRPGTGCWGAFKHALALGRWESGNRAMMSVPRIQLGRLACPCNQNLPIHSSSDHMQSCSNLGVQGSHLEVSEQRGKKKKEGATRRFETNIAIFPDSCIYSTKSGASSWTTWITRIFLSSNVPCNTILESPTGARVWRSILSE